jgi:hypothetical protein
MSTTSSYRANPVKGMDDDTHQTTQPLLTEAERWQNEHLRPRQQSVQDFLMATELDRIRVLTVGEERITSIWLRLIGPGLSLNVELTASESGRKRNLIQLSMDAIPEHHHDIIEIEVQTRSYFADLFVFIRQHNLHCWDFSRVDVDQTFAECFLWAYACHVIVISCSGQN